MKVIIFISLLFSCATGFAQKNFTITYQSGFFSDGKDEKLVLNHAPIKLAIQDSIAYCYYSETPHGDTINVPLPLGSAFTGKFTFYNQHIELYPRRENNKNGDIYLVERKHPETKWKLYEETKQILGYTCKKALGKRYEMKYEIWYTEDLPASFGPYMWTGLPGTTLLSVNLSSGLVTGATEIIKESLPIVEPVYAERKKE